MDKFTDGKFREDNLVEVWGDIVALKELAVSITISVVLGLAGYLLAPADSAVLPLLFALAGIVIATVINSVLFKPKRVIHIEEASEDEQR